VLRNDLAHLGIFFLLPFTLTSVLVPQLSSLGLSSPATYLISFVVASLFKVMVDLHGLRRELGVYAEQAEEVSVLTSYNEVMLAVRNLIDDKSLSSPNVRVFQSHPVAVEAEHLYFRAVINAVRENRIGEFHRIVNVESDGDAQRVIATMRIFAEAGEVRNRISIYATSGEFKSRISFLVFDKVNCHLAFPDLAASQVPRQRFAFRIRNDVAAGTLRSMFDQAKINAVLVPIPEPEDGDAWKRTEKLLREIAATNHSTRNSSGR